MKHIITSCSLLILLLSSVACAADSQPTGSMKHNGSATPSPPLTNTTNVLSFSASGGFNGSFTLRTNSVISKLRHGHKEFTIDLEDEHKAIFLVFYGYAGPGIYHLVNAINGGEVHISLGSAQSTWDLAATPAGSCTLVISSDAPTQYSGIDRMQGTFACPHLSPVDINQHTPPLAVTNGHFTLFIIVES